MNVDVFVNDLSGGWIFLKLLLGVVCDSPIQVICPVVFFSFSFFFLIS
jgi:hypothetical protein